ncbi:hypothetical protein BC830DRAFT_1071736 [Chytriomyces sp. MP71]|nr:hypothetical protein BC830DRAFT_1071736 [Chytriomyces sp. MP71]
MSELCALSQAYYAFKQFQCVESIRLCKSLPRHSTDARICEMIARCCFEMADYRGAEEWFVKTRSIDPHRVSGMDVFSTALWHLRRDVQLSHLAHELVASHRDTAQAWCAVGNCFSLKREHDVALKCFNRAIQIDETYAYAHTLAGHESVAMEDSEQGLQSYRLAVRIDKRHYNAWFGIATIYLSQEKFDLAEFHLRRALDINPSNPVLILYMGLIAEKKARLPEALKAYTLAASLRPDIPLYAFRRASVLFALQRHEEAQHVLAPLDPGESGVHFLVGRVCAARGDRKGAVRAFTLAQDVASGKVAGAIRDEIEKLVAGGDGREGEGEEAMDGGDLI